MPENNHRDNSPTPSEVIRRRRFINRRNTIIVAIGMVCAAIALVLVGLLAFRLGYVDNYIAGPGQGHALEIRHPGRDQKLSHHLATANRSRCWASNYTTRKPAKSCGKIDRMLATIRIEDLYALNLRRNINLKDLQIEGLELWVNFDAQGNSNFRNIHVPPPAPNAAHPVCLLNRPC